MVPGSPAETTGELEPGDCLVGVLGTIAGLLPASVVDLQLHHLTLGAGDTWGEGRRVDVLEMEQLQSLMSNLPKDHPIGMQFLREGEVILCHLAEATLACNACLAWKSQTDSSCFKR